MPRPSALTWLPLWERALETEIGIAFEISGAAREVFRTQLYECRRQANDPRFDALMTFSPAAPYDNEIWICKKATELDASA